MKNFFGNFNLLSRYRPKCEATWNLTKTFKFIKKLQGLTGVYYSVWYGNSKEIKFSCTIFIECCNYTSMAWIQNLYYVKINLCSTYVNEMSIICLKKYLSQNLLKWRYFTGEHHWRVQFYFIEYNYMFHAPQERND